MNSTIKTLIGLSSLALATGCAQPTNPRLYQERDIYGSVQNNAMIEKPVSFSPKVDVLFVIDNSASMVAHQQKLKDNINGFAEAFDKSGKVDFQIGVVAVFDSKRYGSAVQDFYPIGQLQPLKDPKFPGAPVPGNQFVTRAPGHVEVLGESLKIGVIPRFAKDAAGKEIDGGGPEYEELFSPVKAALDGRNAGFVRPEASLAVIMITDADDSSPDVGPEELDKYLLNLKGGDRSKVSKFAVLALGRTCKPDPGLEAGDLPSRILTFLKAGGETTDKNSFSLCDSNYGAKLKRVGEIIQKKAEKPLIIRLPQIPERCSARANSGSQAGDQPASECVPLTVFFNDGKETPVVGWKYLKDDVAIFIPPESLAKATADTISYKYTPYDGYDIVSNRVDAQGEVAP
ncbi:MAG: hypothetical protein V4692_11220 [Bdellovibrionota bacterium]